MSHFIAALHDLRWIIATALLIWAAAWTACKVYAWSCAEVDRMVTKALNEAAADFDDDAPLDRLAVVQSPEPLPAIDATDDEFAAYVARALALANDHTFDNTLGEIRALPERQESA